MDHIEALGVGKPNLAVGIGGGDGDGSLRHILGGDAVQGIAIVGGARNFLHGDVIGAVFQGLGAVHLVILLGGQLLGLVGGLHLHALLVDGLTLGIHQVEVHEDGAALGRNLGDFEVLAGFLILIVGVIKGSGVVGGIGPILAEAVLEGHAVLHDRRSTLVDVADVPVEGLAAAGDGALAQIDIVSTGIVLVQAVGNLGVAGEGQVHILAHGVGDGAVGGGLGDAAGDGLKGGGELGLHVVVLADGEIALGSIAGTGFQGVLTLGAGLEGHGEDGGPGGLGLVGLPDGGYAVVGAAGLSNRAIQGIHTIAESAGCSMLRTGGIHIRIIVHGEAVA